MPDVVVWDLCLVGLHIGRDAFLDHQEDLPVAVTVLPDRIGEIGRHATRVGHVAITKPLVAMTLPTHEHVALAAARDRLLVMPEDADPTKGMISTASPIGRSLVGKEVGDEVEVPIPSGRREFEVIKLVTLHDE